ncbi:hypothetical protein CVE27_04665 [Pseudomonas syringae pv. actinidiae]|nr:hypothetical protein D9N00_03290 [Pseudomonas syringae pv. actinidiae]AYL83470.1 hypothetical protein CN228_29470 [Pseudomonas syringae pv. actinidiae str. Shaanxi_M228]NAT00892.1 hypothetical protein [Pseudomonas syringae pv. actinidiae]NAT31551.1 hypothetical protein [Pseudomonas syringae pv. actinidiae]NAT40988.1 hypothetical protein [Pseudomonas syringae pv. actinidiae]
MIRRLLLNNQGENHMTTAFQRPALTVLAAALGPECVKTRQNVVGAQRLLSVVGYLAPKSFWLSYGGPD